MAIVRTLDVERLRIVKLPRISIRAALRGDDELAATDAPPSQLDRLQRDAARPLGRTVIAQELLDG